MFHAGDQIENPVTGERLVFHETSAETNGERVVFETIVRPGGFVAAAHVLMKLDLRDRVQAVVLAYESGVVQPGASPS